MYWHCSSSFNWPETPDTTAPLVPVRQILSDGTTLRITFNEGMSAATAPSGFVLTRNGTPVAMSPGNISQGGTTLEFTFANPVEVFGLYMLAYTPGSVADDASTPNALASFTNQLVTNLFTGSGNGSGGAPQTPSSPVKYSGPEFSGLSAKPVAVGASSVLEGKRLNEVSSITIGGKAATFTSTETELKLDVPKDLAPGLYDLVINSSAGKLTHMSAIRVLGPLKSFSATTRSEGKISIFHYLEHSLIASRQVPQLNKARCVVNASSKEAATQMAESLCARVRAANPNIETVVVEARSTVKNNSVFARVIYGWN
jgi:phosphoribosylformylglycinamidine (FGAM) synthase PurS component